MRAGGSPLVERNAARIGEVQQAHLQAGGGYGAADLHLALLREAGMLAVAVDPVGIHHVGVAGEPARHVQQQVQRELELELVVAPRADDRVVGVRGGHGDLGDVGKAGRQLAGHGLPHLRVDRGRGGVELLAEPQDAAAHGVHDVMGEADREAAFAEQPDHRVQVGQHGRGGRGA